MGFSGVGAADVTGSVPELSKRRRRRRSFSADIWSLVAGLGALEDWGLLLEEEEEAFAFWLGFCFCFFGGIFSEGRAARGRSLYDGLWSFALWFLVFWRWERQRLLCLLNQS